MDATSPERMAELERELSRLKAENLELRNAPESAHSSRPGRWRRWASGVALALGVLALVPAGAVLWLDRTVVQPDRYIAAMGPVIQQPAVQAAVKKSATEAVLSRVDVNQLVSQALPDRSQFLAAPISSQVENYTATTIGTIVASPRFETAWINANTRAQAAFMKVARSGSGDPTIDLNDVYGFISKDLAGTPLAALAGKQLPAKVGSIQVANVPALERIPHAVAVLDTWRWVLLGLVVLLLALAVWLAPNRRRALVWTGWGIVAAAILTLVAVRITRAVMLDPITDATYRNAAVAVWQTVLNPFLIQILVTSILGLAVVITGWLLGPGRVAVSARRNTQHWLAAGRGAALPSIEESAVVRFVHQHHGAFLWGLLALTLVFLAISAPLTVGAVLTILVVAFVLLLILEFLAAPQEAAHQK